MRLWQILLLFPLICYGIGYLAAQIHLKLKYRKLNKYIAKFQESHREEQNKGENNHVRENH